MNTQTPLRQAKHSFTLLLTLLGLVACGGGDPSPQLPVATQAKAVQGLLTEQKDDLAAVFENGPPGPISPDPSTELKSQAPTIPKAFKLAQSGANGGYTVNPANREEVRLFYKTVYQSSIGIGSGWTGNIAGCSAGDTSSEYKAATLRRINWFRAMAGVPAAIQFDATFNAKAQQAAMLMSANRQLSHYPPSSWTCYNATAAEAAGKSNLGLGRSGTDAVAEGYMRDPGASNSPVGHRRWILYPQTQFMGTGDAGDGNFAVSPLANALWVQDANYWNTRPAVRDDFVAWPTKGYTPYTAVYPRWSFSYPNADFSAATVSMTENGAAIATKLEVLKNGYAENTLVWLPGTYTDGMTWVKPTSDVVYTVVVNNVLIAGQTRSFSYSSTVFDPQQDATGSVPATINGASNPVSGQASAYTFSAAVGAADYQWRTVKLAPFALDDGAETGTANFSATTSPGYSITDTTVFATGASSFHLAHTQGVDQTLQFKGVFVAGLTSSLSFNSRLGLSTTGQTALVEVSIDDGATWISVFKQAGRQSGQASNFGESGFSVKKISLAQFLDKTILLRFRYANLSGSFYPQASSGIGWYIDDVHLEGLEIVATVGAPTTIAINSFNFLPDMVGTALLQVNSGMYGYRADWSATKRLAVSSPPVTTNQIFTSTFGNETFAGGTGMNTVIYSGNRSNYTLIKTPAGWSISSIADGTDSLVNIERLQFADKKIALNLTTEGAASKSLQFIGMLAYNLVKTPHVVGTIISIFDQGKSMKEVCQLAIDIGLTRDLAGSSSNLDLAKLVFRNVVGSEASAGDAAALASYIQGNGGNLSQADFLTAIAALNLNHQHIGLLGLQQIGIEYIN